MAEKLALLGGSKTIQETFPVYNPFGPEEVRAVTAVVESGVLSKFIGGWCDDFYGGPRVQEFERAWEKAFQVKHAVSVNSATSGLMVALGAIGIEPGDEVIVSPWTMCATATSILIWNAIPVFADIELETFGLDPVSIEACITPRTKAIVVTDILGHAADLDAILKIAKRHNLKVIEDTAQAPGALYHGKPVGTLADIGVFSLNYHKHIHTGEGGVCVTNDPKLSERMQLIRNHAEAVVAKKGVTDLSNMIGFNFRLGEMEAAIGIEQLKKLPQLIQARTRAGERLTRGLSGLKGLQPPRVKKDCTHVYYAYGMILDPVAAGVPREQLAAALQAEGINGIAQGYVNVHRFPMFQQKIAYGSHGHPWSAPFYKGHVSYEKGICPVAEKLQDSTFLNFAFCMHHYTDPEVDLVIQAFQKVWANLETLKNR